MSFQKVVKFQKHSENKPLDSAQSNDITSSAKRLLQTVNERDQLTRFFSAKDFHYYHAHQARCLGFCIGDGAYQGIWLVTIRLTEWDTIDLIFEKPVKRFFFLGKKWLSVKEIKGVFLDQIVDLIAYETGIRFVP